MNPIAKRCKTAALHYPQPNLFDMAATEIIRLEDALELANRTASTTRVAKRAERKKQHALSVPYKA